MKMMYEHYKGIKTCLEDVWEAMTSFAGECGCPQMIAKCPLDVIVMLTTHSNITLISV